MTSEQKQRVEEARLIASMGERLGVPKDVVRDVNELLSIIDAQEKALEMAKRGLEWYADPDTTSKMLTNDDGVNARIAVREIERIEKRPAMSDETVTSVNGYCVEYRQGDNPKWYHAEGLYRSEAAARDTAVSLQQIHPDCRYRIVRVTTTREVMP